MAYCKNCGTQIDDNAVVCPSCGVQQKELKNNASNVSDDGNIGWGILGFCIPIVGLVLFLVWQGDRPNNAKMAGKGALISVLFSIVMYVIYVAILASAL